MELYNGFFGNNTPVVGFKTCAAHNSTVSDYYESMRGAELGIESLRLHIRQKAGIEMESGYLTVPMSSPNPDDPLGVLTSKVENLYLDATGCADGVS